MKKQKLTANGMTEQEEKLILLLGEMTMREYRDGRAKVFTSAKDLIASLRKPKW